MNILIFYCCFYLFLSGTILFTILGMFAGSGNPVLLIENSLKDEDNKLIEEVGLRRRITLQYFIAAFLDLCFALIFLYFIYTQNEPTNNKPKEIIKISEEPKINKIEENEKLSNNLINNEEINTNSNIGMSEKEN